MNAFYKFALGVMRFVMPLWYRIDTDGLENLPDEGGYLFVSNHRSMADPILVGIHNPDAQFCFLAKQELFTDGLVGWVLRTLGAVAIDRGTGDMSPLEEIEERLKNGENALIFPEGTRSKDGKLGRFKMGAALIAAQTGVPIVPVAIHFEDELHFRSTIYVRYGAPFQLPQTDADEPSMVVLKQIRQEMTAQVAALLEQGVNAATEAAAALPYDETKTETEKQPDETESTEISGETKKAEDTEETMSKNKHQKKKPANPAVEPEAVKDVTEAAMDEAEDIQEELDAVSEVERILDADLQETEPEIDEEPEAEADESEEDDTKPFRIRNPFKKLMQSDDDFDDFADDAEEAVQTEDEAELVDAEDADASEDEEDAPKSGLFGGFSLKNPFKKQNLDEDALDDELLDEDGDDYDTIDEDEEEEEEGERHVDYGKIALILTFVILGIFAVDFCRRLYIDWQSTQGMLNIQSQASNTVESMSGDSSAPETTMNPALTQNSALVTTVTTTTGAEEETTTTTTEFVDDRETATLSYPSDSIRSGSLVLVNSTHGLTDTPPMVTFADIPYQHLRVVRTDMQVAGQLSAPIVSMFNDLYAATGIGNIMVYNTNGSPEYPPYSVSIPERASGLTLDFAILNEAAASHSPYTPDGNYAWLKEHAADYGFIERYPADKADKTGVEGLTWHYRYVGVPHAKYMAENGLCLEEYLELIATHTWESEHLTVTVNNTEYEMYYVPASDSEATTEIKYPVGEEGMEPLISGDNVDGFIVAVVKPQ